MHLTRWCEACDGLREYEQVRDDLDPSRDPPAHLIDAWPLLWRCPACRSPHPDGRPPAPASPARLEIARRAAESEARRLAGRLEADRILAEHGRAWAVHRARARRLAILALAGIALLLLLLASLTRSV